MHIEYNGTTVETQAPNLAAFLAERAIETDTVATAINGEFVPRARYDSEPLFEGAKLEVLAPMQGG
jgi:sulfur carrier protein